MLAFVLKRLAQALATLVLASAVVFFVARLTGDPVGLMLPIGATAEQREAATRAHGLDRPLLVQYGIYLGDMARGDFGTSLRTGRPVVELVVPRLVNSLKLGTAALAFTLLLSVPLGVLAARYRGRVWDRASMTVALLGQSVAPFWLGMVLVLVFAVWLRWLPTSGTGTWRHYLLPMVALGWFTSAGVVRLLRSSMLEVLGSEYVKLARMKGLTERRVVWRHAVRNALIPVVTFVGFMYGAIIAAAITVEVVFAWPGLGQLAYQAVMWRDFPLIQFTVIVFAAIFIVVNFVVDLLYFVLDPRIRLS